MTEHTGPKMVSLEGSPNDRQSLVEAYESLNGELYRYAFRILGIAACFDYASRLSAVSQGDRDGLGPVDNLRAYLYHGA
jgi:hypothetical protein